MKKILLAGACVLAMSATAMAQSSMEKDGYSGTVHKNNTMKNNTMKANPNGTTTGSSMGSKRGMPSNGTAGSGASHSSNPQPTTPATSDE